MSLVNNRLPLEATIRCVPPARSRSRGNAAGMKRRRKTVAAELGSADLSSSSTLLYSVVVGLLALQTVPQMAFAYDLGCDTVWGRPTADNSLIDCLKEFATRDFGMFVPPLVPALLTIGLLLIFPIAFVMRICGALGSNEPRPGADCCCGGEEWDDEEEEVKLLAYPVKYLKRTKMIGFFVMVASLGGVALVAYGVNVSLDAFDLILKGAKKDILDWAGTMLETVDASTRDENGNFIPPITDETFVPFRDLLDWADGIYTDVDGFLGSYGSAIVIVAICASVVPTVCIFIILMLACCNVRHVLPRCLQWFYYILGLLVGLIGIVFMTLGIAGYCLCGETELQMWRAPGVFQWWAVPQCKDKTVIGDAVSMLREMEVDNSAAACGEMLSICDSAPTYAVGDPMNPSSVIFVCSLTSSNLMEECGSFDTMNQTILEMPFKTNTEMICPSAVCHTFADCAEHCADATARDATKEALAMLQFALNATAIIDKYVPELDCDVIVTRFVGPIAAGERCTDLSFGLLAMGAGATFACLIFVWGIILLCKGQKLFFNRYALVNDEVIEIDVMPTRPPVHEYWQNRDKGKPPTI